MFLVAVFVQVVDGEVFDCVVSVEEAAGCGDFEAGDGLNHFGSLCFPSMFCVNNSSITRM